MQVHQVTAEEFTPSCPTVPFVRLQSKHGLLQISHIAVVDRANQIVTLHSLSLSFRSWDVHCARSDHQEVDEFLQSMRESSHVVAHEHVDELQLNLKHNSFKAVRFKLHVGFRHLLETCDNIK